MGTADAIYQKVPAWLRDVLMTAHGVQLHLHRYGGAYQRRLDEFAGLERQSTAAVASFQARRLRTVLEYAIDHSPYYRELLAGLGLHASDFSETRHLSKLPLLTKEVLRARLDEILTASPPQRGWLHGHTSGTTGSPLSLWYDRETCVVTNAADRLQKRWAGIGDDEWVGLLLGRQVVPIARTKPPYWHVNHAQNQVWFSSLHLSAATLPSYVTEIRRRGLRALEGYPSTLYVLARFLVDRGDVLPMTAVFSSSETLLDIQRETIEKAFAAPLYDFYGHAERALFAIECEQHNGKHLVEPFGITEIVNEAGEAVPDGEFGYIVGTSLFNTAMPMLRYRTGDISAIDRSPCACGRTWARIVGVSTKAEDIVILPDGRWLSPSALTHPLKPFPDVLESQIVQESTDRVTLRIVAASDFSADREALLLAGMRERLGPLVAVTIDKVEKIPRERSGKFRFVISHVPHDMTVSW